MITEFSENPLSIYHFLTHLIPAVANRLDREFRRVVIYTNTHPTLIVSQVIHPVGNGMTQLLVLEVMNTDFGGLAPRPPSADSF